MLTIDELRTIESGTPVYVETREWSCGWDIFKEVIDYFTVTGSQFGGNTYWTTVDYNRNWRLWKEKPTAEQMKAEPWDESSTDSL